MKFRLLPLTLLAVFGLAVAAGPDYPLDAPAPDGRRPGGTLTQEFTPPPLKDEENKDLRRERNYPEQPPTIPHTIRGYQIDRNSNKCLSCHSRANSAACAECGGVPSAGTSFRYSPSGCSSQALRLSAR